MKLTKLHDPLGGQMRVVGLMSGGGSNIEKILEFEEELVAKRGSSPFTMVGLFTDKPKCNANKIGQEYGIPVIPNDIQTFYAERGRPLSDMDIRREFDLVTIAKLTHLNASVAAFGGYMSLATDPLIKAFLGVNVHPADLSLKEGDEIKYTGAHAVRDAILAKEKHLRTSTHIVEKRADYGRILMRSAPMFVQLPEGFDPEDKDLLKKVVDENQDRLKEVGDWKIFPETLLHLAEGRYAQDETGRLCFDSHLIPKGVVIS